MNIKREIIKREVFLYFISVLLLTLFFQQKTKAQIVIGSGSTLKAENGIYIDLRTDWHNNGIFISDTLSYVKLSGGLQSISGNATTRFANLIIDGSSYKVLDNLSTQSTEIANALIFNNQKIQINQNDLVLLQNAIVTNADNQKFVVTNSTGTLKKEALHTQNDFLFPVGATLSSYTPVLVNLMGSNDTLAVRVIDGLTPADPICVQKTYIIKAHNPSNHADITVGWDTGDEGTSFVSAQALMWQQQTGTWTLIPDMAGALSNLPATDWKYQAHNVDFLSLTADSFMVKSAMPPLIITHPQAQSFCENGDVSFAVSATGFGSITYQWQVNCSGTWSDVVNGGTLPFFTGSHDSILTLQQVPYSYNGCLFRCVLSTIGGSTISDSAALVVFPLPLVQILGDSMICEGDDTWLNVLTTAQSYIWNTGDTTAIIHVYPMMPSQDYAVTVTDINSCSQTAQTSVFVTADFEVHLSSNYEPDNIIFNGQSVTVTALPPNYDYYVFAINGDTLQYTASNVLDIPSLTSTSQITVVAYVNECSAQDSLLITVKQLPNAFTPFDKDGLNDFFARGMDMVILNRWGQTIFEGVEGWDGTYKGNQVSPGTYYYQITFNKGTSEAFVVRGSVMVVSGKN